MGTRTKSKYNVGLRNCVSRAAHAFIARRNAVIVSTAVLCLLPSYAVGATTVFTFDDIVRTGGEGDNLFIAENEPLPGDIPPEIRVNAGSIDLQAQTDGMTNFILYFDTVYLDVGDSIRATFDFELLGDLVTHNFPLAFGLYYSNPDPATSIDPRLLEDNISSSHQKFIRYQGYGAYFKPSEEPGQEETQLLAARRANQQGSSRNNFLNQNAQTRFGHTDAAMDLASDQQFMIEVVRTAEDRMHITLGLPVEGFFQTFDSLEAHGPVTNFDAIGLRHGTGGEVNPSIIRITDVQVTATLSNIPEHSYTVTVVPETAGVIDGDSSGEVPEGSEIEVTTTAEGDLVFDRFEVNGTPYPTNPAFVEVSETTDIIAYYVPENVAGRLSGLTPSEHDGHPWHSPWLNAISVDAFPWVQSDAGWLFLLMDPAGPTDKALWVYDAPFGWTYSGEELAPFLYVNNSEAWAFASDGSSAGSHSGRWVGFIDEGEIDLESWAWYPAAPTE
ncbi:MAG: hypothetical protein JJU00_15690 [Opitutales bacterium]|nr:hypothetical protein [Opitutales bacterium]